MICFEKDISLQQSRLDLIIFEQHIFADGLDCEFLATLRRQDREVDAPEGTTSKLKLNFKVLKLNVGVRTTTFAHLIRTAHISGKCRFFRWIFSRKRCFCAICSGVSVR